jgi:hypothetical protein
MVLGLGTYFIVLPAHRNIGVIDASIASTTTQLESAQQLRGQEQALDRQIDTARERVVGISAGFFDEMTTTEAIRMAQLVLETAPNGGHTDWDGIILSDTNIGEGTLMIQVPGVDRTIQYTLRNFAMIFAEPPAETADDSLISDDEIYFAAAYIAGKEGGNIDEIIAEFIETPVLFYMAVTEMLKDSNHLEDEQRMLFLDLMRNDISFITEHPGLISATFTLMFTYSDYLNFLDHLHEFAIMKIIDGERVRMPYRVSVDNARFFESEEAFLESLEENRTDNSDSDLMEFSFNLSFWIITPMEFPDDNAEEEVPDIEEDEA